MPVVRSPGLGLLLWCRSFCWLGARRLGLLGCGRGYRLRRIGLHSICLRRYSGRRWVRHLIRVAWPTLSTRVVRLLVSAWKRNVDFDVPIGEMATQEARMAKEREGKGQDGEGDDGRVTAAEAGLATEVLRQAVRHGDAVDGDGDEGDKDGADAKDDFDVEGMVAVDVDELDQIVDEVLGFFVVGVGLVDGGQRNQHVLCSRYLSHVQTDGTDSSELDRMLLQDQKARKFNGRSCARSHSIFSMLIGIDQVKRWSQGRLKSEALLKQGPETSMSKRPL